MEEPDFYESCRIAVLVLLKAFHSGEQSRLGLYTTEEVVAAARMLNTFLPDHQKFSDDYFE